MPTLINIFPTMVRVAKSEQRTPADINACLSFSNKQIMMFKIIIFLFFQAGVVYSQCSRTSKTFEQCQRIALADLNGLVGPTSATEVCASLANDQPTYYKCLCERYEAVLYCFTNYCPGDPGLAPANQSKVQFCEASNVFSVPSASEQSLPPLSTFASPTGISSSTHPPKSSTPSQITSEGFSIFKIPVALYVATLLSLAGFVALL